VNLGKFEHNGVSRTPLSAPGGRFVRKRLRRDARIMRFVTLGTIGFFNLYFAAHYIRLALAREYEPSLLDESTCVILLPLSVLFLKDQRSWLPVLFLLSYWVVLILGVIIFHTAGIPQPLSAIITIFLDSKLAIMTFAFAWLFKRTGSATQVFESLFILIIFLGLINIPFIFHDLAAHVSIKGTALAVKGTFVQPQGLFMHHTEVAWLNVFGAFAAATRYRLRKRTLDFMLCALFVVIVCVVISIKEMVGCFVGLLIILRPNRSGFASLGVGLAVLAGVAAFVLYFTDLGTAILEHVGMFYGSDAIETVRSAMMNASVRIAAEHFPLGTGAGTFGSAASYQFGYSQLYYDYGIALLNGGSPDMPAFLQDVYWSKLIAEGGALGVTSYLLFLVSCGVHLFYRDPNEKPIDENLRRLCLALLFLVLAISVASSPFTDELLEFVAALCLGYGMSRPLRAYGERNSFPSAAPTR
jgi:hypothetical protein